MPSKVVRVRIGMIGYKLHNSAQVYKENLLQASHFVSFEIYNPYL